MWKSLIRCSVIGGIIVFLWLTLEWAVLPTHKMIINRFTEQTEVTTTIAKYAPRDGIYVVAPCETKGEEPFIFLNIRRGIDCSSMVRPMIQGILMQMVAAFLITYLLLQTKAMKYWSRVWFVTVIGFVVAILGILPDWNWWQFPTAWIGLEVFDIVVGWFLGGLVIAKLVKN